MHKDRNIDNEFHEEYQYLNLIKDVINYGENEVGRNGSTRMIFGTTMEFSLKR